MTSIYERAALYLVATVLLMTGEWSCASRDSAPVVADRPADATPTPSATLSPIAAVAPTANPLGCAMAVLTTHVDPAKTKIYASQSGEPAVLFTAKLAVNTDGAARSYHPDDPKGERLALNNIANAISSIHAADGTDIGCTPRSGACYKRYIETFEQARDAQWNSTGHPRVATAGMIPWHRDATLGRDVPCTFQSGPFIGYFVSQTAFSVDPGRAECDQGRYLDSLAYNAIVLPKQTSWASQGQTAGTGDLVAVRNPANGKLVFGIVGDRGPAKDLGEGTIALAAALRGTSLVGTETYQQIKQLALPALQFVVFPGESVRDKFPGHLTQADVDAMARSAFERWGGVSRLNECSGLPH